MSVQGLPVQGKVLCRHKINLKTINPSGLQNNTVLKMSPHHYLTVPYFVNIPLNKLVGRLDKQY